MNDISDKILDATLEVVAREKISGTRMHLIAKEAAMTQSNIHYYYPTKNDLLMKLMEELQKRFYQKRLESVDLAHKSLSQNIEGLFKEKQDDILNHKKVDYIQFDYWVQGTVNNEIREPFQKSFNEWRQDIFKVLEKGDHFDDLNDEEKELLPFIMVSFMMGASMQYLIDEGKFDLSRYFALSEKLILKMIHHGLD